MNISKPLAIDNAAGNVCIRIIAYKQQKQRAKELKIINQWKEPKTNNILHFLLKSSGLL